MIIGRDFLKLYNVVINNGNDSKSINKPSKPVEDTTDQPCERTDHVQATSTSIEDKDSYRSCVLLNNVVIEPRTEKLGKCRVVFTRKKKSKHSNYSMGIIKKETKFTLFITTYES